MQNVRTSDAQKSNFGDRVSQVREKSGRQRRTAVGQAEAAQRQIYFTTGRAQMQETGVEKTGLLHKRRRDSAQRKSCL